MSVVGVHCTVELVDLRTCVCVRVHLWTCLFILLMHIHCIHVCVYLQNAGLSIYYAHPFRLGDGESLRSVALRFGMSDEQVQPPSSTAQLSASLSISLWKDSIVLCDVVYLHPTSKC